MTLDEQQLHTTKQNYSSSSLSPACLTNKTPGSSQKPEKKWAWRVSKPSGWIIHNHWGSMELNDGSTANTLLSPHAHLLHSLRAHLHLHTAINHLDSVTFTDRKHSSFLKTCNNNNNMPLMLQIIQVSVWDWFKPVSRVFIRVIWSYLTHFENFEKKEFLS